MGHLKNVRTVRLHRVEVHAAIAIEMDQLMDIEGIRFDFADRDNQRPVSFYCEGIHRRDRRRKCQVQESVGGQTHQISIG